MGNFHIDFETRSELDLGTYGAWAYTHHPSFRILSAAFCWDDGSIDHRAWNGYENTYESFLSFLKAQLPKPGSNDTIWAHNAFFEFACLDAAYPGLYSSDNFRCTMLMASMLGLPGSLESLAKALGTELKDKEGGRAMLALSVPQKPSKKDTRLFKSIPTEGPLEDERQVLMESMVAYNIQDVEVERAIGKKLKTLPEFEAKLQAFDLKMNGRGFAIDREFAEGLYQYVEHTREKANSYLIEITDGRVDSPTKLKAMLEELKRYDVEMDSLAAEHVEKMLQNPQLLDPARQLLEIRQNGSKSSTAKVAAFLNYCSDDSRVRGVFRYYGAHTGRWSGKGPQPQNLPAKSKIPEAIKKLDKDLCIKLIKAQDFKALDKMVGLEGMHLVSWLIRSIIVPSKGKKLYIGDFAGIELRVLMELAGQKDVIADIAAGNDLYKIMAARMYDKDVKDITPDERSVGKGTVLGCGYGMGSDRLKESFGPHVAKLFESEREFDAMAKLAVKTFRSSYKEVVSFWAGLEAAFINCVKFEKTIKYKSFTLEYKAVKSGPFVFCHLPTGRFVSYWKPRVRDGRLQLWKEQYGQYLATWGGSLVENITQAVARDILALAMLRLEDAGFPVVLHVHDEIVCEINSEADVPGVEAIFEARDTWWSENFKMAVEGHVSLYYEK